MSGRGPAHASSSRIVTPNEVASIQDELASLDLVAPNLCRWVPTLSVQIDDTAETAASLESRVLPPGRFDLRLPGEGGECARVLASGNQLIQHLEIHIGALKGVTEKTGKSKNRKKTYDCLWSGCQAFRFNSVDALRTHAATAHVQARRPCPFLKCPSPYLTTFSAADIIQHVTRHHLGPDPALQTSRPRHGDPPQPKPPPHLPELPTAFPAYRIQLGPGCGTPRVQPGLKVAPAAPTTPRKLSAGEMAEEAFIREFEVGIWNGMDDLSESDEEEETEPAQSDPKGKGKARDVSVGWLPSSPPRKKRRHLSSAAASVILEPFPVAASAKSPTRVLGKRPRSEQMPSAARPSGSNPAAPHGQTSSPQLVRESIGPPDPSSSNPPTVPSSLESSTTTPTPLSRPAGRPPVLAFHHPHRPNRFPGLPFSAQPTPSNPPSPLPSTPPSIRRGPIHPPPPVPVPGTHVRHADLITWPPSHPSHAPLPDGGPREAWPARYEECVAEHQRVVERGEERERKRVEGREERDEVEFQRRVKAMVDEKKEGEGAEGGGGSS